ncbi:MAG: hypothetical protein E7G01_10490 [Enterococcus faecalis]|nr:hypothetical protein [Enterococcus faecalis]
MERIEEFVISRYMTIEQRIEQLKQKIIYKQWAFYQQSFYTNIAYTGYEIVCQSIKVDKAIETLDETVDVIQHQIEILEVKKHYWQKFLTSLPRKEQQYFHDKYIRGYECVNERLDRLATEETEEIAEAVSLRYIENKDYIKPIELVENDFMGNIDKLLNVEAS